MAWTERWHTGRHSRTLLSAFSQQDPVPREWADASFTEVVLFPMVPYLAWAVLYYAKVLPLPRLLVRKAPRTCCMRASGCSRIAPEVVICSSRWQQYAPVILLTRLLLC